MLPCFVPLRRLMLFALLSAAFVRSDAMSVIAPSFDELIASATTVVRGVVTDVHCVGVDTPQGPAIHTLVTFQVERVLKGTAGADLTLTFLGGKLGPRTLSVVGMPTFKVGEREIVFVANNGQAICPLISAGHGRYHVRHDSASNRDYVARDNETPLASTDEIAQSLDISPHASATTPGGALTPDAFEARIIARVRGNETPIQP
jgi:hypothetical protein